MSPSAPSKRIVIFCDGTWCGRETGTTSNIRILADMVGQVQFPPANASPTPTSSATDVYPLITYQSNVIAGYQEGIGLNNTFLEYLWDGATASIIGEECTAVYKFIVEHFDQNAEVYMFGFSRGSYTVRCVAGMINNCGIIRKHPDLSDADLSTLCKGVYRTYRSPLDIDHPQSTRSRKFREDTRLVWPVKRPIRLLCVGDTVGSLGIPRLNAGVGFEWPEFYDQKVSSVVQEMYHAPCLHDRLWAFEPCLAFNGPGEAEVKIHQTWLPGCHYDLGRQAFRFIKQAPTNVLEKWVGMVPAALSKTVYPNEVLADVMLRWMLEAVRAVEKADGWVGSIVPNIGDQIQVIGRRIADPIKSGSKLPMGPQGSGDVYGSMLEYGPGGSIFGLLMRVGSTAVGLLNKVFPKLGDDVQDLLGIKTVLNILTATQDRRIPGNTADVYPYREQKAARVGQMDKPFTVYENAQMGEENGGGSLRYPSKTYESFQLWNRVFGS